MDISVVRFNKSIDNGLVDMLGEGWDCPLSDCVSLKEFVSYVYKNNVLAWEGLFCLKFM